MRPNGPAPDPAVGEAECLATALWALAAGLWPVPVHPFDAPVPSPGKAPIGPAWGKRRPTEASIRAAFGSEPRANVGLKLGAEAGVVDLDVDSPVHAEGVLARVFPDGIPPTLGWDNAGGKFHLVFLWDDRFTRYGKAIVKGQVQADGGVTGNANYAGVEIRIGAAPGEAKQLQTVIPPSRMSDGTPRRWNEHPEILAAPESLFADLDRFAAPEPKTTSAPKTSTRPKTLDDTALAADALGHLGPAYYDDYEQWVKVGFALRGLGPTGLGLWDDWSRGSEKYQAGRCAAKWRTMLADTAPGGDGITLASLFKWAASAGWVRPAAGKPSANGNGRHAPEKAPGPRPRADLDKTLSARPRTDLGNAERLVARHRADLRYCHPWKKWLAYDGLRWKSDDTAEARRRAKATVRAIMAEAQALDDDERRKALALWGLTSEKRDRIAAMLHLAEAEEGVPVLPAELDADPWLFNCRNGTVDLRTGKLRPHDRGDLITKLCDVDYDTAARCPLWEATLETFFARPNSVRMLELVDYWQRLCGYALAGVVRDHVLPVAYGTGSNGKSTILGTMLAVVGADYAMKAPPDMFMAKGADGHPTDRADLFGKRLVVAIESESGRRLNEVMVKELTGGDRIRARRMREDFWEFTPTHTLIMATNHKPAVRGTDRGIWRRLRLIPFTVALDDEHADKAMPEKLRAEYPGILRWIIRGCLEWQERGLDAPKEVTEATAGYRAEQDLIGAFLAECTVSGPGIRVKAGDLYRRYAEWAAAGNEHVASMRAFGTAIEERGTEKKASNGFWYIGIGLMASERPP